MNITECVIDRVWTLAIGVLILIEAPALIPWLIPLAVGGMALSIGTGRAQP